MKNYSFFELCAEGDNEEDSFYLFGSVRRLKPFYYYYCDKWAPDQLKRNFVFDDDYKANFTDKFGRLDSLKTTDDEWVEDQAYLITHNFVEPKKENAETFR